MRPEIELDTAIVAANARAWGTFAGFPLYGVVKGNGYAWGLEKLVRSLDGIVDAFCVADADELGDLRRHTSSPAIVLGDVPGDRLCSVLRQNALANISSPEALELAAQVASEKRERLRVRVGLRPAAAWSGMSPEELHRFAPVLAHSGAAVSFWSHITDLANGDAQIRRFEDAASALRAAGVREIETDLTSTFSLAKYGACAGAVRIGAGLFGATGGTRVPGVRCAVRLVAACTRLERVRAGSKIGYGDEALENDEDVATVRCGYIDGLPEAPAGIDGILAVGMQYASIVASRFAQTAGGFVIIGESTDLDALASRSNRLPHEIITALGNAASATGAPRPS